MRLEPVLWGLAIWTLLPAHAAAEPEASGGERTAAGRVIVETIGAAGVPPRRVTIVLPEPYDAARAEPYPVVYVHDGQGLGPGGFGLVGALDALTRQGVLAPHVLVGVDATEARTAEYTLSTRGASAIRQGARGTARDPDTRYVDYVAETVTSLVAARAHVDRRPERTTVVGFSYGALAALHCALRWPERFGRVIAFSPSLWRSSRRMVSALEGRRGPWPRRVWLDVGTLEGRPRDAVPYMVADARLARAALERAGLIFGRHLGYHEVPLAEHAWGAVSDRAGAALRFTLGDEDLSRVAPVGLTVLAFRHLIARGERTGLSTSARYAGLALTHAPGACRVRVDEGTLLTPDAPCAVRAPGRAVGTASVRVEVGSASAVTRVRVVR